MLMGTIKKLYKKIAKNLKDFYEFMIFVEEQRLRAMEKSGRGWM